MLYLLHISPPLGGPKHVAEFYLGYSPTLRSLGYRVQMHQQGRGARITQVAVERGCVVRLLGVKNGDRREERRLKNQGHHARLAPLFKMRRGLEQFC